MRLLHVAVLALLAGYAPGAVAAQDGQDTVVEALVVTAAKPNPAWWEVRDGESVVWILGGPMGPLPKSVQWNATPLERRIGGAKTLILPSGASVGLGDAFSLLRLRGELKQKTPLEQSVPPELAARFAVARTALGKPASRYDGWTPVWAGRLLRNDYYDHWKLDGGQAPERTARDLARRGRVKVEHVTHRFVPVLKSAAREMREEEKVAQCLEGNLENVETPPERYRAAAEAWARGDVRRALDVPKGGDICRELFMDAFVAASVTDQVEAISEALKTPGASVAVVPLRQLLLRDGVLEQLARRGYEITDPSELVD